MPPIKIVMLGSGGVGKSAISIRFIHNNFVTDYDPTIENSYRKHLTLDSQEVMLDVLDTAGQEEYAAMRDSQIRSGMGFVLVYSITSRESFKDIRAFRDRILHVKDKDNFPCVMVGNKSDLQKDRAIETAEAMQLATELGIPFKECSAKTSSNITETFEDCTRLILRAIDQGLYEDESGGSFIPAVKRKKGGCFLL